MPQEKSSRVIYTAAEAIRAFDKPAREGEPGMSGANYVARLFGIGPNAVRNWYKRGLPPESHDKLAPRLRALGYDFSDEKLFQQYAVASEPRPPPAKKPRKNGGKK